MRYLTSDGRSLFNTHTQTHRRHVTRHTNKILILQHDTCPETDGGIKTVCISVLSCMSCTRCFANSEPTSNDDDDDDSNLLAVAVADTMSHSYKEMKMDRIQSAVIT